MLFASCLIFFDEGFSRLYLLLDPIFINLSPQRVIFIVDPSDHIKGAVQRDLSVRFCAVLKEITDTVVRFCKGDLDHQDHLTEIVDSFLQIIAFTVVFSDPPVLSFCPR